MVATPTRSALTVLLAVDPLSYSDTEATPVACLTWPAGTAVRVLAIVKPKGDEETNDLLFDCHSG